MTAAWFLILIGFDIAACAFAMAEDVKWRRMWRAAKEREAQRRTDEARYVVEEGPYR